MHKNTDMQETNGLSGLSETLTGCLELSQSPVAVCFTNSLPQNIGSHQGSVSAGCRFWEDAATTVFATSSADHELCAIGIYTHNLAPSPAQQTDLMDAMKVFGELGYVRQEDLASIPVLQSRPRHIVSSPLADSPLPPDVVLLFVNARQALILVEAAQQVEGHNSSALGRPACAVIPQVMNTGRAALSLGCCGARAYLDILTDDIAIFALPGAKLESYVGRIEALAKANAVLSKFHLIRRRDIANGQAPTIQDSLRALGV